MIGLERKKLTMKSGSFFNMRLKQAYKNQTPVAMQDVLGHVVHAHKVPDKDVLYDVVLQARRGHPAETDTFRTGMANFYLQRAVEYLRLKQPDNAVKAKALANYLCPRDAGFAGAITKKYQSALSQTSQSRPPLTLSAFEKKINAYEATLKDYGNTFTPPLKAE
jgi:hypothetical protein